MTLPYNTANNLLLCSLATLMFAGPATAANFDLSKFIEVGATSTDNLALVDEDSNKDADQVIHIKPSVELKFSGNRFGVIAQAELDYQKFTNAEKDILDPSLFVRARGTLIDNLMFLDSTLSLTKTTADNSFMRPTDDGETSATSNTRTYIDKSFGQFADFYTGYTFSTIAQRVGDEFGASKHTLDFRLERNPKYNGFLWGIGASYSLDKSGINEFKDGYVYGKLGMTINQTLLTQFTYGLENRELLNATNSAIPVATEYENTPLWNIELKWSPSELTSLTLGYGDRFFGSGPSMQLKRRIRNSSIIASYTRDISREQASLDSISTLVGSTDTTITNTDSVTIDSTNNLAPLNQPFVDSRFRLGYKLTGRRSDLIADAIFSDKESLAGSEAIKSLLGRLAFDRRLSEKMTLRLQYDYQKSEASDLPNLNYIENRFAIKFIYSFDGAKQINGDELESE